ncbi:transcriptional regulator [Candidatus Bathyarchaeota archaeon ex4484_231]|nr:MAG: transcriptional regulator [Candidatus Bathyarchaeota archaeon ex4484_231]RLG91292.1 MAG: transcriptional regulator [Candidatus Bathyarchaeota archaeon]HDO72175.1 Lrp/AsnC family transcriptional regulator [Candidatus Bathyarchaeota archaeon]HEX69183.1 Lrp/AsnC family transcriptional regulator [Candidatus Bathyarchaeota archaeon]
MVRISNIDIIRILQENSRIPYLEIAKTLGVSETAIRKRIRKLEEEGIIRKYTIEVDHKKLGFEINTLIGIDTKPENYLTVLETLKNMEDVKSLYSASGDHMILIECWFQNSKQLTKFCRKLQEINGVTRICPAIILEKIK